jgi:hypothetical protein
MTRASWAAAIVSVAATGLIAASAQAPEAVPPDAEIRLARSACYGTCPVYTVAIDAAGHVVYTGQQHVKVSGEATARITAEEVAGLLATADRIGFFDLQPHYRSIRHADGTEESVTDLPTTTVTVTKGGRNHTVEDYFGAPASLREFERAIDRVAGTRRWTGVEEPAAAPVRP